MLGHPSLAQLIFLGAEGISGMSQGGGMGQGEMMGGISGAPAHTS